MLNFQQKEKILKKYFGILRKCSLFDQIEDQHLIAMLSCLGARRAEFDKKYTIFAEGSCIHQPCLWSVPVYVCICMVP